MRRVYYHKTYYTYMHLKPLTDTAIQLQRYASVFADMFSVEYTIVNT